MVKFKLLKYKHLQDAARLTKAIESKTATQVELDEFIFPLVAEWDFLDAETDQPVPVGKPGELTIEQYNIVYEEFGQQMSGDSKLKKTNASPSRSGSTPSSRRKR